MRSALAAFEGADRFLIFASAGLRAVAISLSSILLAVHLAALGFSPAWMAVAISLGLAGCACGTFLTAFISDHVGRRTTLLLLSFFMALGGFCLAFATQVPVLFFSLFAGMVNGMGRDRGAGLTVEQAMLSQVSGKADRTKTFAWYNVIGDSGNALGAFLSFLPSFFRLQFQVSLLSSYRWTWIFYALLCLVSGLLVLAISGAVELKGLRGAERLSAASRPLVKKFIGLSGLDSFGGGFLTTTLLSYWFFKRFGVNESFLGPLFFFVRVANGLSHLAAAWLAKRIGLVNTMVFTHLPANFLLIAVAFAPSLPLAVFLFLAREALVEMDVPTRQSYLLAIVKEEERTFASGLTNLTRGVAWAAAPLLAGPLMQLFAFSAPLFAGAGIKVVYDLLLYRSFRHVRPPEEERTAFDK